MTGLPPNSPDDLELLIDAARESGEIALRYWKKDPQAWNKEAGAGPVSEADLAIDRYLHHRLTTARPDYGWLSEESEDNQQRLAASRCFICDPIDGTRAFIEGNKGFSHALAVVEDGRVVAGVVYLPVPDILYAAVEDGFATRNGAVMTAREVPIDGARVLTAKASFNPAFWKNSDVPALQQEFCPSLAWRLCLVGEAHSDSVLSLRGAWEWDIAAGALIAERAGCTVTDMRGRPMRFNQPRPILDGLLTAPPLLHAAMLSRWCPRIPCEPVDRDLP